MLDARCCVDGCVLAAGTALALVDDWRKRPGLARIDVRQKAYKRIRNRRDRRRPIAYASRTLAGTTAFGIRPMDEKLLAISELAQALGTTPRAIRFYEDKGLISPHRVGSNRCYGWRERQRLALILRGKRLGLTLREIAAWLALYDEGPEAVAASPERIRAVERRIAELMRQREDIERTIAELAELQRAAAQRRGCAGDRAVSS